MTLAPAQDPMVPARTIPHMVKGSLPVWARCAAGGITISLGSGTMELSTAMRSPIRGYPPVDSKVFRYQVIRPSNIGGKA
jgi:hypothetical protein